jgi:hypothetical protein
MKHDREGQKGERERHGVVRFLGKIVGHLRDEHAAKGRIKKIGFFDDAV